MFRKMTSEKEDTVLFVFRIFILIVAAWAVYSPRYQSRDEIAFYNRVREELEKNQGDVPLKELTGFDWDTVDIVVQPDTSWNEGWSTDIVKAYGLKYSIFNDLHLPKFIREYEALFIFSKNKNVVKIYRLNRRDIEIGDQDYVFWLSKSGDTNLLVLKGERPKNARWAWLMFCEPKDKEECLKLLKQSYN